MANGREMPPPRERGVGLGERARAAAARIFDVVPNVTVLRSGHYVYSSTSYVTANFGMETVGRREPTPHLIAGPENPKDGPYGILYYIGADGTLKMDRFLAYKQQITQGATAQFDMADPATHEAIEYEARGWVSEDEKSGRNDVSAAHAYKLLTGLQTELGDKWQGTIEIPEDPGQTSASSAAFVPAFRAMVDAHTTQRVSKQTHWTKGDIRTTLEVQEEGDQTRVSVTQADITDPQSAGANWIFLADGRLYWRTIGESQGYTREDGIQVLESTADELQEYGDVRDAFQHASTFAQEIHAHDPLVDTSFRSRPRPILLSAFGGDLSMVRFDRFSGYDVDGSPRVGLSIRATRGPSEDLQLPWYELRVGPAGEIYSAFPALEGMVETGIFPPQYAPDVLDYNNRIQSGTHGQDIIEIAAWLSALQMDFGNDWPEDADVNTAPRTEQGLAQVIERVVTAKTFPEAEETVEITSRMTDTGVWIVETISDERREPHLIQVGVGENVWRFTPEGVLDLRNADDADVFATKQVLDHLRERARELRELNVHAIEDAGILEGLGLDTGLLGGIEGPQDEGEKGGAWTAGSHHSGETGKRTPSVEMRGDEGEVHEIHPEGDEPEKGNSNGRE